MENKKEFINTIDRVLVFILGIVVLTIPFVFATLTTDPIALPKQLVLFAGTTISLLLLGGRFLLEESVRIRRTPFDLPILLFTIVVFISSILAVNQSDSLQTFVPFLFIPLFFFCITNSIRRDQSLNFFTAMLGLGGVIISLVTIFSYLKIYLLPMSYTKVQTFTPFGSLFDQAIYLAIILSVVGYFAYPTIKNKTVNKMSIAFGAFSLIIFMGLVVSIIAMVKLQPTRILPYETGLQTGVAAISQDNGRVIKSLAVGTGFGTYFSDFTRFKPASFNQNVDLWSISFFRSSSFVLELLATTGILGLLSFLLIAYRVLKTKPLFIPAVVAIGLAVILPLSFPSLFALFVVLGILSATKGLKSREKSQFFDIELHLVAFKKGILAITEPESRETSPHAARALSGFAFAIIIVLVALTTYYMGTFALSDITFQKSFAALSQNNGGLAYDLQGKAISYFPGRDGYHRIFSQLNLNIANNLASSIPQGSSPSAQQQQTIYQLIQQSINSARQATTISPQTATNWQNLSSVYRGLIGFGQNADNFAIVAAQQAAVLDPNNPQEYITLGGIFYQLGQWDNAITQFQNAVNLKPDYPNAYYNLGHAYEQKGDLKQALAQYQAVKTLVAKDQENLKKINEEIKALESKIAAGGGQETSNVPTEQLNVDQPQVQLPAQPSPVKIPGPGVSPTPSPSASPTPQSSATPEPNL